jgi:hypothetical protein
MKLRTFREFTVSLAVLVLVAWGTGVFAAAQVFQAHDSSNLEIRNYPVTAHHNFGGRYEFQLSILAIEQEGSRLLPLLAIAVEPPESGSTQSDRWLAVWNLNDHPSGIRRHLKALVPGPWGPQRGNPPQKEEDEVAFPAPYFTAKDRKTEAWTRVRLDALRRFVDYLDFFNPARFPLRNYLHYRNDLKDRRFHQTYALIRLYEDLSLAKPASGSLSPTGIVDLKYQLLINRRALGILMEDESKYELIEHFESDLRKRMGNTASYLHSQANFHNLGFKEIRYGLPGRPPVCYAALLYAREVDMPDELPQWPRANPFGLSYNPFQHRDVRRLMAQYPEEEIPLAFYVLASDFEMKPILVADFFRQGGMDLRGPTATLRMGLDNYLAVTGLPFLYRAAERIAKYGIDKKEIAHFSEHSTAAGVEPLRIMIRLDANYRDDTNQFLLRALENRISNPFAESFLRETENARLNFTRLLTDDGERLSLELRTLYEDQMRRTLGHNKAIFAADHVEYRAQREYLEALSLIRSFNSQTHLTGYSWSELMEAFATLRASDGARHQRDLESFVQRLVQLFPGAIPERYRQQVAEVLIAFGNSVPSTGKRGASE